MAVNKSDSTELKECQDNRKYCGNCKNGLCPFSPLSALSKENSGPASVNVQQEKEGY